MDLFTERPRVPDAWVEHLFKRMGALYGSAFTAKWRDVDPPTLWRTWAEGMATVPKDHLTIGYNALESACPRPPSLAEFLALCSPPPAAHRPAPLPLPSPLRTSPEQARENLGRIKAMVDVPRPKPGGIEWARNTVALAKAGQYVAPMRLRMAYDAIANHRGDAAEDDPCASPS
ncbi:hypothetical protein [Cupriavidus taiwanensis]|uniref:hypothetical protein n=1 Tax=Cupriavidus taiwanensis TaxID=164546 RepID=UPI000E192EAF|nr:hypothetical protein [Cupriavidus taiwanensis]SPA17219.1 conserved hypothetical protein [Cupriavidus taiwanensis]